MTVNIYNEVVAPSDGYLFMSVPTSTATITLSTTSDGQGWFGGISAVATPFTSITLYMRKDTKIYISVNENNMSYRFVSMS